MFVSGPFLWGGMSFLEHVLHNHPTPMDTRPLKLNPERGVFENYHTQTTLQAKSSWAH